MGGHYASEEELQELIDEAYPSAIDRASLETFEGMHSDAELEAMIDVARIKVQALAQVIEE